MPFDSRDFENYHVDKVSARGMFACLADKYRVEELVGGGSFSVVYRASEMRGNRKVAVKALLKEVYDSGSRKYAEAELNAMGQLWEHPNIISALTVEPGNEEFLEFIVMEYVDGGALDRRLERGPLPIRDALAVSHDICCGLAHAHQRNIVHRDIKPSNILLTSSGEAKVSDFGVAELREAPHVFPSTLAGTRRYMAPEQYNDMYDERVDVFAVGILLWEMIMGVFPYIGTTHHQIQRSKATDPEPPSTLPSTVKEILRGCLRADPFDRFRTIDEMLPMLESELTAMYRSAARDQLSSQEPAQSARARLDPLRSDLRIGPAAARSLEELAELDRERAAETRRHELANQAASDACEALMECVMRRDFEAAETRLRELTDTGAAPDSALETIEGLLRMLKGPSYGSAAAMGDEADESAMRSRTLLRGKPDAEIARSEGRRYEEEGKQRKARKAYKRSGQLYAQEGGAKREAGDSWHAAEKIRARRRSVPRRERSAGEPAPLLRSGGLLGRACAAERRRPKPRGRRKGVPQRRPLL